MNPTIKPALYNMLAANNEPATHTQHISFASQNKTQNLQKKSIKREQSQQNKQNKMKQNTNYTLKKRIKPFK